MSCGLQKMLLLWMLDPDLLYLLLYLIQDHRILLETHKILLCTVTRGGTAQCTHNVNKQQSILSSDLQLLRTYDHVMCHQRC